MKATEELWRECCEAAKNVSGSAKKSSRWKWHDPHERQSAMAMEFMEACKRWRKGRLPFVEFFMLRFHNRLSAMRRRLAIRHRLIARAPSFRLEKAASRQEAEWDRTGFMDSLDARERRLVEAVLGYDQRRIVSRRRRDGDWPVQGIMAMARKKMERWGWDKRRQRRVIEGVRQALIESRSA